MLAADAGLAEHRGAIAGLLQEIGDRLLPLAELRGHVESPGAARLAAAHGKFPVSIE